MLTHKVNQKLIYSAKIVDQQGGKYNVSSGMLKPEFWLGACLITVIFTVYTESKYESFIWGFADKNNRNRNKSRPKNFWQKVINYSHCIVKCENSL